MDETKWYLRKAHDGSEFGPIDFQQLRDWAAEAQVAPLDRVSTDNKNWVKAPMIPELEMDYLVEMGEDQYYGPTTVGALREFLAADEITPETSLTNCKDGTKLRLNDLLSPAELDSGAEAANTRAGGGIRVNLQQRIRELEERLEQERRAREMAEHLVEKLEAQIAELEAR
jgi:hypothetical protein